jgi:hypothetical protein
MTISIPHDPPDDEMTPAQAAQLQTLSAEANVTFETGLSKANAAKRIDALQRKLGCREKPAEGGDGGTSIRANEAPSVDQPPLR